MNTWIAVAIMVLVSLGLGWMLLGILNGTRIERGDPPEKLRLSYITYAFGNGLLACVGIWLAVLAIVLNLAD